MLSTKYVCFEWNGLQSWSIRFIVLDIVHFQGERCVVCVSALEVEFSVCVISLSLLYSVCEAFSTNFFGDGRSGV